VIANKSLSKPIADLFIAPELILYCPPLAIENPKFFE
jgi:hypothetical protein